MKKIIVSLTLLLLLSLVLAKAQGNNTSEKSDSTKIKVGKSTLIIVKNQLDDDKYDYDFGSCEDSTKTPDRTMMSVDFGMNGYMAPDFMTSLPADQRLMELNYGRSRSFGFSILHDFNIVKERLYFSPGLGINWNNYHFKNNVNISTSNEYTAFTIDSVHQNNKYKLRATYLQVPLIVGVRIGNLKQPLGIQFGMITGYRINSIVKQKYKANDADYKVKINDDFNINPFKVEALVRVGIGDFGFFAKYSLTTLFENNKAPELYPFSAGITMGGFVKDTKKQPKKQ